MESVDAIDALSAGFSNFAPPPPASVKVQNTSGKAVRLGMYRNAD